MEYIEVIFAFFVTISFALLFEVNKKLAIYSGFGGALSWFFYMFLSNYGLSYATTYLIATSITAFYSEIIARKLNTPVPVLLISALIPLAPGGGIYYTMLYLIQNNYQAFLLKGVETLIIAGSMAFGIILISTIFKIFRYTDN